MRSPEGTPIADGDAHWQETALLCQAVALGNAGWGVPAYDGGLFESDASVSQTGAELADIALPKRVLRDRPPPPPGYRDAGRRAGPGRLPLAWGARVRNDLRGPAGIGACGGRVGPCAQEAERGTRVRACPASGINPSVYAGETYLHNRSGARKSSGSYYTKPFAVEHLLNGALEPALRRPLRAPRRHG